MYIYHYEMLIFGASIIYYPTLYDTYNYLIS